MPSEGHVWALEAAKKPLVKVPRSWETPPEGHALLAVLGCGVCHTDLGFADGDVAPRAPLPLVLGHEVVGRVVAVTGPDASRLEGRRVLAPAVSPCGKCPTCKRGRATSCPTGKMPGNDADGGFATHVVVPAHDLVVLDEDGRRDGPLGPAGLEPWEIAPVADAATTAYQAVVRARVAPGDVAIFVGAGGVGGFGAQIARAMGAKVVAVDVSRERLDTLEGLVDALVDVSGLSTRDARAAVRGRIKESGWSGAVVRVFETSGTTPGQETAFELIERGGSLSVVGYTRDKVSVRLSNIMALDAELYGNWGCDPALFPEVVRMVLDGRVQVRRFVERRSLDDVNQALEDVRRHVAKRRLVLVPG